MAICRWETFLRDVFRLREKKLVEFRIIASSACNVVPSSHGKFYEGWGFRMFFEKKLLNEIFSM